tara:strand:+ start:233 stop:3415 length:3183 start_codon:yes stop_codon:yes gene_type:complete
MANEILRALRYGIDQPTENVATTLEALGFDTQAKAARELIDAPEDYESYAAKFINEGGKGFDFSALPLATVEQAGQLGGSILSRIAGAGIGTLAGGVPGAVAGALIGPALFEAIQIAGPVAFERARNNGRTEPNWEDWSGALSTSAFSGALNAFGVQGIGRLNSTIAGSALREGVTEGLQGATEQIGSTGLTEAGLQIDPKQIIGEGLIGGTTGGTAQVPSSLISTGRSIENLRQDIVGDAINKTMFDREGITPAPLLEETNTDLMQRQLELTEQDEAIAEYRRLLAEEPVSLGTEPRNPRSALDQLESIQTYEPAARHFVRAQRDFIDSYLSRVHGALSSPQRMSVKIATEDYLLTQFGALFNPDQFSSDEISTRIQGTIDTFARSTGTPIDVEKAQMGDDRFDFDAVPLQTRTMDYDLPRDQLTNENSDERYDFIDIPPDSPRNPPPLYVDPIFNSKSIIMSQVLPNFPNDPIEPEDALKLLNVKESDSQYLYAPIESGGRAGTRDLPKITREAVNLEVAPFLYARARKPKDDPSRKVTKRDIKAIIYDTLSRFQPVEELGGRNDVMHYMSSVPGDDLNDLFAAGQGNVFYENSVNEWTRYDARIPPGDDKETSYFRNNDPDTQHNPTISDGRGINQGKHDKGGLMWWRGFNTNDPVDGEPGVVAFEFQANNHGKAQSARSNYKYVSQIKSFDDEEIQDIQNRLRDFNVIKDSLVEDLKADPAFQGLDGTVFDSFAQGTVNEISQTLTGYQPSEFTFLGGYYDKFFKETEGEKPFTKKSRQVREEINTKYNKQLEKLILKEQPFAPFFTVEKRHLPKDKGQNMYMYRFDLLRNIEPESKLQEEAERLGGDESPQGKLLKEFRRDFADDLDRKLTKEFRKKEVEIAMDLLPTAQSKYPKLKGFIEAAAKHPTEKEVKKVRDARQQLGGIRIVPDSPFKKNYINMDFRRMINWAIDNGKTYVYFPSAPDSGPSKEYQKLLKEAKSIAKQVAANGGPSADQLVTKVPNSEQFATGPWYRFDIRSLTAQMAEGIFQGFDGYKKGGLVTRSKLKIGNFGELYV